jgi:hypothetical protein
VGTRCWIVLLEGRDEQDPFFLQITHCYVRQFKVMKGSIEIDGAPVSMERARLRRVHHGHSAAGRFQREGLKERDEVGRDRAAENSL